MAGPQTICHAADKGMHQPICILYQAQTPDSNCTTESDISNLDSEPTWNRYPERAIWVPPVDLCGPLFVPIWELCHVGEPVEFYPSWTVGVDVVAAVDCGAVMTTSPSNLKVEMTIEPAADKLIIC